MRFLDGTDGHWAAGAVGDVEIVLIAVVVAKFIVDVVVAYHGGGAGVGSPICWALRLCCGAVSVKPAPSSPPLPAPSPTNAPLKRPRALDPKADGEAGAMEEEEEGPPSAIADNVSPACLLERQRDKGCVWTDLDLGKMGDDDDSKQGTPVEERRREEMSGFVLASDVDENEAVMGVVSGLMEEVGMEEAEVQLDKTPAAFPLPTPEVRRLASNGAKQPSTLGLDAPGESRSNGARARVPLPPIAPNQRRRSRTPPRRQQSRLSQPQPPPAAKRSKEKAKRGLPVLPTATMGLSEAALSGMTPFGSHDAPLMG
eukprot:gene21508-59356_t